MHSWKGAKKLGSPPPALIWTKSKQTAAFPQENVPQKWYSEARQRDTLKGLMIIILSSTVQHYREVTITMKFNLAEHFGSKMLLNQF